MSEEFPQPLPQLGQRQLAYRDIVRVDDGTPDGKSISYDCTDKPNEGFYDRSGDFWTWDKVIEYL